MGSRLREWTRRFSFLEEPKKGGGRLETSMVIITEHEAGELCTQSVSRQTEFSLIKLHKTNLRFAMTDDKLGTMLRTVTKEEIPNFHKPHIYTAVFALLKLT